MEMQGARGEIQGAAVTQSALGGRGVVLHLFFLTVLREMDAAAQWSWLIEDER